MLQILRGVFLTLCLLMGLNTAFGQLATDAEIAQASDEQKIEAGEAYFAQKRYFQSLRAWNSLLKDYPDNPRINYMAGKCLFLSGVRREKSYDNFKHTIGHISDKLTLDKRQQDKVPLDALFYLGCTSHLNHRFDEAIGYYNDYLTRGGSKLGEAEKKEAERWKQWSINAKQQEANPNKTFTIVNMGPEINSVEEEYAPVLSLDEEIMYFTSRRMRADSSNKDIMMPGFATHYEDVYLSYKLEDGTWARPKMINFGNEPDHNEATVSVSADGLEVYIYNDTEAGGDLYKSSFLESGFNAELEHIEGEVNSPSWETHCSITPDGQTLFFTSNRAGGIGGLDIYRVVRLPGGSWSKAVLLPEPINTIYDEDSPFIHPSGNILYYSSNHPGGMGGCDVYSANILGDTLLFTKPVNMGYPLNTVDDDVFFVMNAEGSRGYYSSAQNDGYGEHDIFKISFNNPLGEPFAILKGHIANADGSAIPDDVYITATSTKEAVKLQYKPRQLDGGFVMALTPCEEYELVYYQGTQQLKTDKFTVPCKSDYQELHKEVYLDTMILELAQGKNIASENPVKEPVKATEPLALRPAFYEEFFDYNDKDMAKAGQDFSLFIGEIAKRVQAGQKVIVNIDASASNVPTTTFKTNTRLAQSRAQQSKQDILSALQQQNIPVKDISFNVKARVQGPAYRGDYDANKKAYGEFQYVKLTVR